MQIFFGYFIMNSFKTYGADTIKNDAFLTVIGSVGALTNGVMRIFWSSLLDYFPFRRVNSTLLLIQIGCLLSIQASAKNQYTYMVVVALSMMCEGSIAAI